MFVFTLDEATRLLGQHSKEIKTFLHRRVGCPDTADDLLQELFIRLVNAQPAREVTQPRAFMYRVASNLATDHLRSLERQHTRTADATLLASLPDSAPSPDEQMLTQEQVERLKQAVAELPPRRRQVFILCKFEQLTYLETAKRLGISESAVIKHMVKALDQCRKRVMEDFP